MLEGSDFDAKYTPAVRYFSQWARDYDGQKYYYKQGLLGYEFIEEVCGDDLENDSYPCELLWYVWEIQFIQRIIVTLPFISTMRWINRVIAVITLFNGLNEILSE